MVSRTFNLQAGPLLGRVFIVLGGLSLLLVVGSLVVYGSHAFVLVYLGAFGGVGYFVVFGLLVFGVVYSMAKVTVSPEGVDGRTAWGSPEQMEWAEVERVELGKALSRQIRLKGNGKVVALSVLINGWPDLALILRDELSRRPEVVMQLDTALRAAGVRASATPETNYPREVE
jgi:hypothetical protein